MLIDPFFHSVGKLSSGRISIREILFASFLILSLVVFFLPASYAQDEAELIFQKKYAIAQSDSERVMTLATLAEYYYAQKEDSKGDSIVDMQIMLSEESRNQNLILFTLFHNARFQYINSFARYETDKSLEFIKRALDYATERGLKDYIALAWAALGTLNSMQGNQDLAFKQATIGFTTALHTNNDSVLSVCALVLGDIHQKQADMLRAFQTYTNAYDYARKINNTVLLSRVYHSMSDLFRTLDKDETAKEYLFKSLELNRNTGNIKGQLEDYFSLGKLLKYEIAMAYLQRAERLADSVNNLRYKLGAQRFMFLYKLVQVKPSETLAYLDGHPQLQKLINNSGKGMLDWYIAEIYLYQSMPDSALKYFTKAQENFDSDYDLNTRAAFFEELAMCYSDLGQTETAIQYFRKAMEMAKSASDLLRLKFHSAELKTLYEGLGDYKQALYFGDLNDNYSDSASLLSRDKDLAFMQIENENKRRLMEEELAIKKKNRRHDLQYMGITIAISAAFVILMMLGMFKTSKLTIRIVGFFAFILLFEFIILILDNYIHHITHGEPLKIWGIKIVLISMLFPLHHFLEEKLIHYLASHKLIKIRSRFSLNRLIFRDKKPVVDAKPGEQKDPETTAPKDQSSQDVGGGQIFPMST